MSQHEVFVKHASDNLYSVELKAKRPATVLMRRLEASLAEVACPRVLPVAPRLKKV